MLVIYIIQFEFTFYFSEVLEHHFSHTLQHIHTLTVFYKHMTVNISLIFMNVMLLRIFIFVALHSSSYYLFIFSKQTKVKVPVFRFRDI